ncbi:MAG: ABC transporter permease [Planctomycetota bacterium]
MLALARMTWAHSLRQPATLLAGGIALVLLLLSFVFGIFNFDDNDRIRLLATSGVAIGALTALFLAVYLASTSIHDELASRTALTLFAKPLSRGAFLIGKAGGIWLAIGCVLAVLMLAHYAAFLIASTWGFGSTAKGGLSTYGEVWIPWGRIVLAHLLTWAHAAVLVAITSTLALRLGLTANIIVSFAIFVTANLLGGLGVHGLLVLPASALFAIDDVLQFAGQTMNPTYFALSLLYAGLYSAGSLLLGLALFERQDIP